MVASGAGAIEPKDLLSCRDRDEKKSTGLESTS
jgi:hypothetical protein